MLGWETHSDKTLVREFVHLDEDDLIELHEIKDQKRLAFEIVDKLPNALSDRKQRQIAKTILGIGVIEFCDLQDKKALEILRLQK